MSTKKLRLTFTLSIKEDEFEFHSKEDLANELIEEALSNWQYEGWIGTEDAGWDWDYIED